jgi:hypothetical protein
MWYDWMHTMAGAVKDMWKCTQSLRLNVGVVNWEREVNGERFEGLEPWKASSADMGRADAAL